MTCPGCGLRSALSPMNKKEGCPAIPAADIPLFYDAAELCYTS